MPNLLEENDEKAFFSHTDPGFVCCTDKKDYPVQAVPFTEIHMNNGFRYNRMETNRFVTISYKLELLETTGRIKNFAIAGCIHKIKIK